MADPADNHDNITKELCSPFAIPFLAPRNAMMGTVAGTVLLTVLPNTKEAREIITVSTKNEEYATLDIPTVFDPAGGGHTTHDKDESNKTHLIGRGLAKACLKHSHDKLVNRTDTI